MVAGLWESEQYAASREWSLRIREILGELVDGIQDSSNPVSKPIADFYVFLLKLLTEAETTQDRDRLETLRELLSIEEETWREVVARFANVPEGTLEFEGDQGQELSGLSTTKETILRTDRPIMPPISIDSNAFGDGAFNLEM